MVKQLPSNRRHDPGGRVLVGISSNRDSAHYADPHHTMQLVVVIVAVVRDIQAGGDAMGNVHGAQVVTHGHGIEQLHATIHAPHFTRAERYNQVHPQTKRFTQVIA